MSHPHPHPPPPSQPPLPPESLPTPQPPSHPPKTNTTTTTPSLPSRPPDDSEDDDMVRTRALPRSKRVTQALVIFTTLIALFFLSAILAPPPQDTDYLYDVEDDPYSFLDSAVPDDPPPTTSHHLPMSFLNREQIDFKPDMLHYSNDGLVYGWDAAHERLKRGETKGQEKKVLKRTVAEHPIQHLIQRGKQRWASLLERQSKTLPQAVSEYKRRYRRPPPHGFDHWWQLCKRNGVKIVDDYDQIDHDVAPFFALTPYEFRRRQDLLENLPHSFQINFDPDGEPSITGIRANSARQQLLFQMLAPLNQYLSMPVTLYVSDHDMGNFILPDAFREAALTAAAEGRFLSEDALRFNEGRKRTHIKTLEAACPEDSPAWREAIAKEQGEVVKHERREISFVHDPLPTYDYCYHPYLMDTHGVFSHHVAREAVLRPVFQMSKTIRNNEFVVTPFEAYENATSESAIKKYIPWEKKTLSKVFWRGSMTGDSYFKRDGYDWHNSHRIHLHFMANANEGQSELWVERRIGWEKETWLNKRLNEVYFDIGLSGKPHQCKKEDGTCDEMAAEIKFKDKVSPEDAAKYKFALDVDGNGWSSRFHRLLLSGSAVIKSTVYNEWNGEWLTPWVHYIPTQIDYSDLYSIISFFAGPPDGRHAAHDDLAREIAEQGRKFAMEHWRWEDMQAYMFRLILEYQRLQADDRDMWSFEKSYD